MAVGSESPWSAPCSSTHAAGPALPQGPSLRHLRAPGGGPPLLQQLGPFIQGWTSSLGVEEPRVSWRRRAREGTHEPLPLRWGARSQQEPWGGAETPQLRPASW